MQLRDLLKELEASGDLVRIKKEVNVKFEMANVINSLGEKPVIFENVKGHTMPVFAGIASSRDIIARGLGTTKEDMLVKLVEALGTPKEPELLENPPCQEVVIHDPDLNTLPFLTHLDGDGGPYATATVSIIKDKETGRNACYHRLMRLDSKRATARLIPKRQTRTTYDRTKNDIEMAICIGNSTSVMIAASLGPPSGVDELAIANALSPTPLAKCITLDLEVPAHSEIVIEGRLTRDLDREGPFVDLTETRDFERQEPVFVVDCITTRNEAMYQALIPGRLEHKLLMGMPKEPTIYEEVSKVVTCTNVVVTMGGGSWLHSVVQIEKENPDDGIRAIQAAFKGHKSMKQVTIFDSDVDIYDPISMEWALATRFQATSDMLILPKQPGSSLDPSSDHSGKKTLTSKLGLDATKPTDVDPKKYEKVSYGNIDINDYLEK